MHFQTEPPPLRLEPVEVLLRGLPAATRIGDEPVASARVADGPGIGIVVPASKNGE